MAQAKDEAERWRLRAVKANAVGDRMRDPKNRSMMHGIAAAYEFLAENAEGHAELIEGLRLQFEQAEKLARVLDNLAQPMLPDDTPTPEEA